MKEKILFLHTPKTGGGSMEWMFWNQTKHLDTFFFSFNGIDYSHFNKNEFSTNHPRANKCLIETIHYNPSIVERYNNSPHFNSCKLLLGHTTSSLPTLFPKYNFKCMMVIREPIERTISNICQFSQESIKGNFIKFGAHKTSAKKYSEEYWDFIYEIITKEKPIRGLLKHENCFLRNCMSRMICGSKYNNIDEDLSLDKVIEMSKNIYISLYNDFNNGIQKHFDLFDIPIDMSKNTFAKQGKPNQNNQKKKNGKHYGAPEKIIEFVKKTNMLDIEFYKYFTENE